MKLNPKFIDTGINNVGKILMTNGSNGCKFSLPPQSGEVEKYVLSDATISSKYIDVELPISSSLKSFTSVEIPGSPPQLYNRDFNITNDDTGLLRRIVWNGFELDGILNAGDSLIVRYYNENVVTANFKVFTKILDNVDILKKSVDVPTEVSLTDIACTRLLIAGSPYVTYDIDFKVIVDDSGILKRISWSGTFLDGELQSNDGIAIIYRSASN